MAKRVRASLRTEFDRLKADYSRLRAEMDNVREQLIEHREDLGVQFTRIAEIQAVLDEERIANRQPREPRPLLPSVDVKTATFRRRT